MSGNPEPVITWYKDDMEIIGATRNELIIPEADLADRAMYYCTASNSLGSVTSEQAFLNIKGKLSIVLMLSKQTSSNHLGTGVVQYAFTVNTREEELFAVDEWVIAKSTECLQFNECKKFFSSLT